MAGEKQNKGRPGTWLRQITTGLCYPWSPHKEKRADMVPWTGPLPWEGGEIKPEFPEGHGAPVQAELTPDFRIQKIKEAIADIQPKNYAQATGDYPAMPKVKAVSFITGFDVTKDEILEAMGLQKAAGAEPQE